MLEFAPLDFEHVEGESRVCRSIAWCVLGLEMGWVGGSVRCAVGLMVSSGGLSLWPVTTGKRKARLSPGLIHFRGPFMRGCLYGATLLEFWWLAVYVPVQEGRRPWGLRVYLFAHHAVSVGVAHVLVSRVSPADRRDAVGPGLGTGDATVTIVVP